MSVAERIVFLPRFSALLTGGSGAAYFTTSPLDVSAYSGARFLMWRGSSPGELAVYFEESLDGESWVQGPSTPSPYLISGLKLFSYDFFLRWFRMKFRVMSAANQAVTCWAEAFLSGGAPAAPWPPGPDYLGPLVGQPRDPQAEARERHRQLIEYYRKHGMIGPVKK